MAIPSSDLGCPSLFRTVTEALIFPGCCEEACFVSKLRFLREANITLVGTWLFHGLPRDASAILGSTAWAPQSYP